MAIKYVKVTEKPAEAVPKEEATVTPKVDPTEPDAPEKPKIKRGFALWSKDSLKKVASKGGKNTPPEFRNFSIDKKLAKRAAKKRNETNADASS